jgi:hypothetical protein
MYQTLIPRRRNTMTDAQAAKPIAQAEVQLVQAQKALDGFNTQNLKDWAEWTEIDADLERGALTRMRNEWLRSVTFLRLRHSPLGYGDE